MSAEPVGAWRSTMFYRSDLDDQVESANFWACGYAPDFRPDALAGLSIEIAKLAGAHSNPPAVRRTSPVAQPDDAEDYALMLRAAMSGRLTVLQKVGPLRTFVRFGLVVRPQRAAPFDGYCSRVFETGRDARGCPVLYDEIRKALR